MDTDRKGRHKELKVIEDKNYNLLEQRLIHHLPVAVYTCDKLGHITFYNPAAALLWGREPVAGRDLWCGSWKLYDSDGEPLAPENCPMFRTLKEGIAIEGEIVIIERPDGTKVRVKPYPVPLFNSEGKLTGAINTLIHYTDIRKAEENQALLASIVNSSDDAIISKTLDGTITSWNRAAERLFGYTPSEVIGKHISLLIPADRLQEEELIIGKIARGENVDHFETIRSTKDGTEIPISLTISPVTDLSGKIIGASKIARDISEQIKSQETNERLFREIKALNEKKDEFIGIASHELKTPLTSISGYLQILDRFENDGKGKKFLQKTILQVNKLTGLVSDMLDVSKIEAGKLQYAEVNFDIRLMIDGVLELIEHTQGDHEITLETTIESLFVKGDQQRLEQVMINLITNAIKYSSNPARISIYLNCTHHDVTVGVKDSGFGIAKEKLTHIFSLFYRVEDSNPTISGLGIGLYITSQIIERHHGKIWAESEPGKGSTFWFSIPRSK
ncbi:MAG TPA: PAS domain S-box protein [Daejeonella sp.]|nr:PAS domain S-box protein [Daejeonella sp.]